MTMRTYLAAFIRVAAVSTLFTALAISATNTASLSGVVQSGGTFYTKPLPNAVVTLFEATTGSPNPLGTTTSDPTGHFVVTSPINTTSSIFFVTADVAAGIKFVTILGPNLPTSTTINELTTVAASYSMAQFYKTGVISGNSFGLQIAAMMNDNLVVSATGTSSPVLLTSPNADETNSLRSTRTLANVLVACVHSPATVANFLALTTPPGGPPPHDTAEALADLARHPAQNVFAIYILPKLYTYYSPPLIKAPDAWTITVKVNDSGGDKTQLFAGLGNLVFDAQGYAWISNNVFQGMPNSSNFMVVLKPNGKPSDGSNNEPVSPVTGGGILGGGYGITIDPTTGDIWEGNFGWGNCPSCLPTIGGNGSVSQFTASGIPLSPSTGYQGCNPPASQNCPLRAQGMVADAQGNIWIASFGNDSLYVFPGGDTTQGVSAYQYPGAGPFGIALVPDGTVWMTNGGGIAGQHISSVVKYQFVNGTLQQVVNINPVGMALKGISVDSLGNAWVASQGTSSVYVFGPDGTPKGQFGTNGQGGVGNPWGVTVDGDDNVWVSSFGPLQLGSNWTNGRISKLCGFKPGACPPGVLPGQPISPSTGYTVPSARSQVRLHDGTPLYGKCGPPSYTPLMRLTNSLIDQAGNVWALNNWKPDFNIDITSNPGGDGVVIFVGLATPPATGQ